MIRGKQSGLAAFNREAHETANGDVNQPRAVRDLQQLQRLPLPTPTKDHNMISGSPLGAARKPSLRHQR